MYLAARRRRFGYARRLDELLGEDRVLVTPTNAVEGIYADGREIGAAEPGTESSSFNTGVQNLTGHPALTVPAGLSPNGVPFGLQITGPRFADELVLAVGQRGSGPTRARRRAGVRGLRRRLTEPSRPSARLVAGLGRRPAPCGRRHNLSQPRRNTNSTFTGQNDARAKRRHRRLPPRPSGPG